MVEFKQMCESVDASGPFGKRYWFSGVEDWNVEFFHVPEELVTVAFTIDARSDLGLDSHIIFWQSSFQHLKEGATTFLK